MRLASFEKIRSCAFKLGMWISLSMILPQLGWAAGTPSGTSISNSASLTYAIGAGPVTTAPSNTVSFTVDDKVNVLVAGGQVTNVAPGQNGALTPFTVTNTGNATQGYALLAADAVSGPYTVNVTSITDNFDPAAGYAIFRDNNCDGAINGTDAVVTTIPTLPANAGPASTACLLVQTDIAPARANGDAAVVSLKATTLWPTPLVPAEENTITAPTAGAVVTATAGADTADVDVVFADAAGVVAGDAASDGTHSTYGAFSVSGVNVTLTKTLTSVVDPSGGPVVMTGTVMSYQIAVAVSGTGTATGLVITDPLPAQTSYVAGSIVVDGAPQTDADDPPTDNTDFGITTANAVTVKLGNVASPANHVITFKATIN